MARISSLEDQLYRDQDGTQRDAHCALLCAERVRIEAELRKPHTAEDYQRYRLQMEALDQTTKVITVLWQRYRRAKKSM